MAASQDLVADRYVQPRGAGGILGRIGRIIVMVCTAGFVFPNAWIEGMNPTEIDRKFWRDDSAK